MLFVSTLTRLRIWWSQASQSKQAIGSVSWTLS